MTREATNKILELVDEGILDAKQVLTMALGYMSEFDVADMADANELFSTEDEDNDDIVVNLNPDWSNLDPDC